MWPVVPFSVHLASQNGVARLELRGELDMSVVDLMTEPIATSEKDGVASIVLDLRDLTFLDSTGLHAILDAWRRAEVNGHQLRVVGASGAARRLFELTGTEFLIDETEVIGAPHQLTPSHRSGLAPDASAGDRRA